MSDITSMIPQGIPIIDGGVTGFAMGYFLKKLLKIIILGIRLVFALITTTIQEMDCC
jgi:uncharacterized membrane protein (Fun14 family)